MKSRQIAFYGKGGVGKSTIVSNLSACFATGGKKVLQIGCDPKQDSTRNLIHRSVPVTVIELFAQDRLEQVGAEGIVMEGYGGVDCVEVGGPEPGIGCAGRGIIKMFEVLEEFRIFSRPYDYVLYDVLGDVVCGGFAMPMRSGYAREIYIIVAADIMSLYAANNICRGIVRYAKRGGIRLGGLVVNCRVRSEPANQQSANYQSPVTKNMIYEFAQRINTQVLYTIPYSSLVMESERKRKTLIEYAPGSEQANEYRELSIAIERNNKLNIPTPMNAIELDEFLSSYTL